MKVSFRDGPEKFREDIDKVWWYGITGHNINRGVLGRVKAMVDRHVVFTPSSMFEHINLRKHKTTSDHAPIGKGPNSLKYFVKAK